MKRIRLLIVLLITAMTATAASQPDFAYPKQVSRNAEKDLAGALKRADGPATVRALMDFGLAQGAISSDNVPTTLDKIAGVSARADVAPATRAILALLRAEIYRQIYTSSRWIYDERTTSGDSLPTWSARQLTDTITALCTEALGADTELKAIPVGDWRLAVKADATLYPTLMDFVASKAIGIIDNVSSPQSAMPLRWLCGANEFAAMSFRYASPASREVLEIYAGMLRFHRADERAFVNWDLQRLRYVSNHTPDSGDLYRRQLREVYARHHFSFILPWCYEAGVPTLADRRWLYEAARQWPGDAKMKSLAAHLARPRLTAEFNPVATLDSTLSVTVRSENASAGTITVYRLPASYNEETSLRKISKSQLTKIGETRLTFNGSGVFEADTAVNLRLGTYGCYLIVPTVDGEPAWLMSRCSRQNVVTVTDIALIAQRFGSRNRVFAVSPLTGGQLDGVSITTRDHRTTASRGADRYTPGIYTYTEDERTPQWRTDARMFTDLAIYHPGDSLSCAAVVWRSKGTLNELAAGQPVRFTIRDANWQTVDTLSAITDASGRAVVSTRLPADGLTGRFIIELTDNQGHWLVCHWITVSDYRQPTYEIKASATVNPDGSVTVSGSAVSFAGFPIADAAVKLELAPAMYSWRYFSVQQPYFTTTAVTGNDGQFSIDLPRQLLADSPLLHGLFSASVMTTSPSGESAETSVAFATGHPCQIWWRGGSDFNIADPGFALPVRIADTSGNEVDSPLTVELRRDSILVASGRDIDWASVASGIYSITVATADTTLAAPLTIDNIALYRPTDRIPVRDAALWLPDAKRSANAGATAEILYGCSKPDAVILVTTWTGDTIMSQQWLRPGAGMHRLAVGMPDTAGELNVTFASVYRGKYSSATTAVTVADRPSELQINVEAMRDRITPGDREQWTFRVTDNLGNPARASVMLDMYARALDLLAPASWEMSVPRFQGRHLSLTTAQLFGAVTVEAQTNHRGLNLPGPVLPDFETYGRLFAGRGIYFRNTARLYGARAMATGAADIMEDEAVVEEVANLAEVKMESAAAKAGDVDEDVADSRPATDNEPLRTAMPLAMFEPLLATDAEGNLALRFTAPNANTTWRLRLVAYTADLMTGSATRDIISSKPVMVQPTLPRFLRTGDSAVLRASVMNNTDSTACVVTTVEIFNPATGAVVASATQTDTLAARASILASIRTEAPAGTSMLGYRVRSRAGRFTDGEQAAIPVLPSEMQVLDTYPFYIQPDSASFAITVPVPGDDASTTLQFTENAVWSCVTALPGLRADDRMSTPAATAALFSCAVADGLMRRYPQIGRALHSWQGDSTLISNLERNNDLKIALLGATPWVAEAAGDTERMARLSLLFDRREVNAARSSAINRLAKLVSGGGLKWVEQSHEASLWVTLGFLNSMGQLKTLGFLPDNERLNTIIREAWAYADTETARDYADYPAGDYTWYVATRDMFPDLKPTAGSRKITAATVQRLVGNWRNLSATGKAVAAMILNAHGYSTSARKILESLAEYEAWRQPYAAPDVLRAFAAVNPSAPEIDRIRQHLLLQKQTQDWGGTRSASAAIAAILSSGTQWLDAADGAAITIDGTALTVPEADKWTGAFTRKIPAKAGDLDLRIDKGRFPAWGAVYVAAAAEADAIAPHRCDDLAIDKRIYAARGTEWIETNTLAVGDKVRVSLTITAGRTMDYVTVIDRRAACLEPVEQLPAPIFSQGIRFYRENRDSDTNIYIDRLPKGSYVLTYDLYVTADGRFASGIAEAQSLYAPEFSAHSGGTRLNVE